MSWRLADKTFLLINKYKVMDFLEPCKHFKVPVIYHTTG